MFAKRKPKVLEGAGVPRVPDLAGEILRLRGQVEAFLDAKVAELKSSRDGASVPIDFLRHQLTGGETSCHCRAAMRVLADESNG